MYLTVLALGLLISLTIAVWFVRSPAFSLFHPFAIYTAFHLLIFVIRPIVGYWLNYQNLYTAYHFTPSLNDRITVIAAANLGYVAFALFCLRAGNVGFRFAADACTLEERRRLTPTFVWVACICLPIAIYSLLSVFGGEEGSMAGMVLDRQTGISIHTKSNGYLLDAQLMLAPLCAIIAWLGRFRLVSLVPIAMFVVARGGTGGRGPFIAALVMLLLLYLYEKRQRYPGWRIGMIALVVVAFFSWIGVDRGEGLRGLAGMAPTDYSRNQHNDTQKFMETMDLANMEFFEYIVWVVPQQSGTYDYFLSNLQVFTEPIPRVLWPGKPIGAPIQRVHLYEYGFPIGMTQSLPGTGWYSMGWFGVFIWCGLWGHVLGTVYRRFCQSDQSSMKTAAYMIFIASLVIAFRDGELLTMVRQIGVYMTPVVVWLIIARLAGVPSLAAIRRKAILAWQNRGAKVPDNRAAIAAKKWQSLPPAVRRRRLAMQPGVGQPGVGQPGIGAQSPE